MKVNFFMLTPYSFPLGLVLLDKLLPRGGLVVQQVSALLEVRLVVVAGVLQQQHVLQHLLGDVRGEEGLEGI